MLDLWLVKRQFGTGVPGRDAAPSFQTPARGDVYDFTVMVYCKREVGQRLSPWRDDAEYDHVSEHIRATVRRICRAYPIFEPAEAEQEINETLCEQLPRVRRSRSARKARWTARVELGVPEEIRTLTRKVLRERHEIEARADASGLRMEKMEKLRQDWDRFLTDALKSPTARQSLRLAEKPQDIAEALEALQKGQRQEAEEFLTLAGRIVEALHSADILDVVLNSETVLHHTLKMMGIDLHIDPDRALVPIDAE